MMTASGQFLTLTLLIIIIVGPPSSQAAERLPFLLGGDVSLAPCIERSGIVFKDGSKPADIFAIFRAHCANCIRLRLFVHPDGKTGVVNDLPYTLTLAKRVKAAGLLFILDLHYSDTWADPGNQATPAAWQKLDPVALANRVREYTSQTLRAFVEAGAPPEIVQIGNEITPGLLWPVGKLGGAASEDKARFDQVAALLKAGVAGVHEGTAGGFLPRIMLHIDGGESPARATWFFDAITERGVPFDMIGLSYYPFYKGKLADLTKTLEVVARRYHYPVAVVETAYPHAEMPWIKPPEGAGLEFPTTLSGQRDFLRAIIQIVRSAPDGLGAGVLYWYPESVPVHSSNVNEWHGGKAALFDHEGNALPAFGAFGKP